MESLYWAVCWLLGVPAIVFIAASWLVVMGAAVGAVRKGRSRNVSFAPPFLGGIGGALACLACPWTGVWHWAWVPLLLDASILLVVAASLLHVVARVGGLRSPFDGEPSHEEQSHEEQS